MTDTRPITLHVGAHKTATSMLQTALRHDGQALRHSGLGIVRRKAILKTAFYRELKGIVLTGKRPDAASTVEAKTSFAELTDRPFEQLLITSEDLLEVFRRPRFYANAATALSWIRSLTERPIRFLIFTRSQPSYVESMYMQRIHLGDSIPFDAVKAMYDKLDLSWSRVLDAASEVIGAENVRAIPYESIKRLGATGYYQAFLRACGVDRPDLEVAQQLETARAANRSYSAEGIELALAINPLLDKKYHPAFRRFLQEHYSTATQPRAELFSRDDVTAILEKYRAENRRLFTQYLHDYADESAAYGIG